jgi:hypothetical protein
MIFQIVEQFVGNFLKINLTLVEFNRLKSKQLVEKN